MSWDAKCHIAVFIIKKNKKYPTIIQTYLYAAQLIIVLKSLNHIYFIGAVAAVIIW